MSVTPPSSQPNPAAPTAGLLPPPGRFDAASSRAATPMSSGSKRGTIILGSGRGRRPAGQVLARSKLPFDSSFSASATPAAPTAPGTPAAPTAPGTPSQHSTDGSAAFTDISRADRLAAGLARKGQVVFAQSGEMTVTFSEDLPTEVRGVIERGGTRLFAHKKNPRS